MQELKRAELVQAISKLAETLNESEKEAFIASILEAVTKTKKEGLPISIFRSTLSGLEAVVVYLKDNKEVKLSEIARLLNRNKSTIYSTYRKAEKKQIRPLDDSDVSVIIPYNVFADRKFSLLESLVSYLKEQQGIPFIKIASLLNKSYSTVMTVYRRHKEKCR